MIIQSYYQQLEELLKNTKMQITQFSIDFSKIVLFL
jgi:hypothetical protein